MSAVLFWKKRIALIVAGVLSTLFVLCTLMYARVLFGVQKVDWKRSFYFLVSASTHVEASTHLAELYGGAGYLLEYKNREYVALSVYLNKEDGLKVSESVSTIGQEAYLLPMHIDGLYFKTTSQKREINQIKDAFGALDGCIEVLHGEIKRLAGGATQESTKRILGVLIKQFDFLNKEYAKVFSKFSGVCEASKNSISSMLEGKIYLKDLRYVLCELCASYVQIAMDFSL